MLYLIYGDQAVYRREAKFSVLTALSHLKQGEFAEPTHEVCRHGWWESASHEIRGWDEAEQQKFFGTSDSHWPKQLPRPSKPADEQKILAFLRQQHAR